MGRSVSVPVALGGGAEEGGLIGLARKAGRIDVGFHLELEIVPGGDQVDLAAFLAEVEPPLHSIRVIIADLELGDGAGAGGGIGEDHEQGLVAEADRCCRCQWIGAGA